MVWTGSRSHGDRRHRESIHTGTDDCRLHGAYSRAKPSPFSSDLHTLHSCACGCVHVPSVKVQWESELVVVVTCHVLKYSMKGKDLKEWDHASRPNQRKVLVPDISSSFNRFDHGWWIYLYRIRRYKWRKLYIWDFINVFRSFRTSNVNFIKTTL